MITSEWGKKKKESDTKQRISYQFTTNRKKIVPLYYWQWIYKQWKYYTINLSRWIYWSLIYRDKFTAMNLPDSDKIFNSNNDTSSSSSSSSMSEVVFN